MDLSPLAQGRPLNWRPSLGKHHTLKYKNMESSTDAQIFPHKVDLRPLQSPVWDQGQSGSCSGYSAKSGYEFLQLQALKIPGLSPEEFDPAALTPVSAFFIYWNERALEGSSHQDAGATTLLDACITLKDKGAASEASWPSIDSNLLKCPPSSAYGEAWHHKLTAYYNLDGSLSEFKRCLNNGFPFLFGIAVYTSFMSQMAAVSGVIPWPRQNDRLEGGHALLCVGYDDAKQAFIFKNSWSAQWGDHGYGYLPYEYMLNSALADDFYTLRREPTLQP